jgi:hypothetical protein
LYFRKQSPAVQKNAKFIAACKTASAWAKNYLPLSN